MPIVTGMEPVVASDLPRGANRRHSSQICAKGSVDLFLECRVARSNLGLHFRFGHDSSTNSAAQVWITRSIFGVELQAQNIAGEGADVETGGTIRFGLVQNDPVKIMVSLDEITDTYSIDYQIMDGGSPVVNHFAGNLGAINLDDDPLDEDGLRGGYHLRLSFEGNYSDDVFLIDELLVTGVPVDSGLVGDFDGSGLLDAADVDLLTEAIRAEAGTTTDFDVDGSGTVDDGDLTFWVETLFGTTFGDANLDKIVNLVDLSALATNFDGSAGWAGGNFNSDTSVNLIDLSALASNFGVDLNNVPEPAGLLGLSLILLNRRQSSN